MYTTAGLAQLDQPFAKLEFSMSTFYLNIWWHKATIDIASFARLTVVDYAFLTDVNVIEPFELQVKVMLHADLR